MARLVLSSYQAKCEGQYLQVAIMSPSPFPSQIVEVRNVADCEKALEAYRLEALATGKPMVVSMSISRNDRKPAGFDKLKAKQNYVCVNL